MIVDDDLEVLALLKKFFVQHGYSVEVATEGASLWAALERQVPDLIILDLMLPGENGLTLCQRLRQQHAVPVIMLTAMGELSDRVVGLEMGADDYLSKPFDARELLARVRAVLRRAGESRPVVGEVPRPLIRFADWQLDLTRRELRSPDQVMIPLSAGEFDLLLVFVEHPQRILSREQLLDLARGQAHDAFDRSIDVQVSRLRRKLEFDTKRPAMIRTVRNGGYLFTPSVTRQ
ncbi:DNA-binding response regulator GltR, controls specific porins for the entry of glucose [Pseudomonas chlororaphis subsp. aurantiaca]|uniref:Transcriptional regulatory protein OmpR n=1 Tax=Pseudomonas chlororaphis TaxID=587753 RepID=A0AAQ1F976_9PSED|nr:DNA-binding response regulator GltR, controls specific porins for the entry of glucose [Pseudomonas chlororaphis subsp. piscium]AZD24253.1 DNA-binding response regulator GltR, controls specific porins for the entry of glucose [Pseudomonas chlororaphis subsp. aurantiaca]AZD31583.1 DNA-binding response regulator GltR, controls specific porins for the entry of glucose [Pseudomonas chlororaphis]AZD88252.1 DNA-binding response regulator GltR, controls specific porins for the entry of glucose [Pseu